MSGTKKRNEVTNFMYYMYNRWSYDEAVKLYGENLGQHIYEKYQHLKNSLGILFWYSELDDENRQIVVDRANEIYD